MSLIVGGPRLVPVQGDRDAEPAAGVLPALEALAAGRALLLVDEAGNAGYFVCAAERATTEFVVNAATYGRGVLKAAMTPERLASLGIPALGDDGDLRAPVDLIGNERGLHADQVATLRALADPTTVAADLVVPGHVFPSTAGTCASFDDTCVARAMVMAAELAGQVPVVGYCEAVDEQGFPADRMATARLARRLGATLVSVRDILVHHETVVPGVTRVVDAKIPTPPGPLTAVGFRGERSGDEYVAFLAGGGRGMVSMGTRVHIHRRCQLSDVFGGLSCGCGDHLRSALQELHHAGAGMVVYFGEAYSGSCAEARGEVAPAPDWVTTVELAGILRDLGARRIFLSSNEPLARADIEAMGITIESHASGDWFALPVPKRVAGL